MALKGAWDLFGIGDIGDLLSGFSVRRSTRSRALMKAGSEYIFFS